MFKHSSGVRLNQNNKSLHVLSVAANKRLLIIVTKKSCTTNNNLFHKLTMTYKHNMKTCWNSEHMVSFKCLALVCVIWPELKSKTSSERSFNITMLFWHMDSFDLLAPTMSGIKDVQFLGHSLFNICMW